MPTADARPRRLHLIAAYAIVYVVWGSTYLAIHFAIETLPPFLMGAVRFLVAGALLAGWARLRGAPGPTPAQWRAAAIVGGCLLLGGNGAVIWAQASVPSGIAALLVAILPLWMVILERLGPERRRPTRRVVAGIVVGIVGLVVLIGPGAMVGDGNVDLVGALVLVLGSLSWAVGSLYAKRAPLPASQPMSSGAQMLMGGLLLGALGLATGESPRGFGDSVSTASLLSLLYLIVFGSLVAFSAFAWLLRVEPPSRVATYAYVNPVVAVLLGWAFANEPLTLQTMIAAAIIVGAVAMIVSGRATPAGAGRGLPAEEPEPGVPAVERDAGTDTARRSA